MLQFINDIVHSILHSILKDSNQFNWSDHRTSPFKLLTISSTYLIISTLSTIYLKRNPSKPLVPQSLLRPLISFHNLFLLLISLYIFLNTVKELPSEGFNLICQREPASSSLQKVRIFLKESCNNLILKTKLISID